MHFHHVFFSSLSTRYVIFFAIDICCLFIVSNQIVRAIPSIILSLSWFIYKVHINFENNEFFFVYFNVQFTRYDLNWFRPNRWPLDIATMISCMPHRRRLINCDAITSNAALVINNSINLWLGLRATHAVAGIFTTHNA